MPRLPHSARGSPHLCPCTVGAAHPQRKISASEAASAPYPQRAPSSGHSLRTVTCGPCVGNTELVRAGPRNVCWAERSSSGQYHRGHTSPALSGPLLQRRKETSEKHTRPLQVETISRCTQRPSQAVPAGLLGPGLHHHLCRALQALSMSSADFQGQRPASLCPSALFWTGEHALVCVRAQVQTSNIPVRLPPKLLFIQSLPCRWAGG